MKRKFSLFLNVMLMVLCISSIAFGVYSAQKAQLNITGNLGFTAHNAFVSVTGFVKNVAQIENDNVVGKTDIAIDKIVKGADTTDPVNITMPLGDMYFYSNDNNVSAEDIVFELTFTNLGSTDIIATITKPSLSSTVTVIDNSDGSHSSYISFDSNGEYKLGIYAGASATIQFALHLKDMSTLSSKIAFNMPINFEDAFLVHQSNDFFWNKTSDNMRSYVTMGTYTQDSTTKDIRWYIFAKSDAEGNMTAVTSAVDTNGTLDSGTYWFISEYVLGNKAFDFSLNVYGGSNIQLYLSGTEKGSFINTYGIDSSNPVYSKITGRTINDAAISSDSVGAVTTSGPQTFWLLSVSELSHLNNGSACSTMSTYKTLIANDTNGSAATWWLRSPLAGGDSKAFRVRNYGLVDSDYVDREVGVRAAFQITI